MDTATAAERWSRLVKGRLAEMRRLAPDRDSSTPARYWNARARSFAAAMTMEAAARDPFLKRLRRETGRATTVLDVGAGSGRFAVSLAPGVAEVTAVDPSAAMLKILRRQARRAGVTNVAVVEGRWEDVDVEIHDVAFSSFVLPLVADAPRFLAKLDGTARRRAFLYLSAFSNDALLDPLWRHFHGRSRRPAPTYIDAVEVLREMGIRPSVEVVRMPVRTRFPTMAAAVKDYRSLLLVADDRASRAELRRLLRDWLLPDGDGFAPPLRTMPAAVISW